MFQCIDSRESLKRTENLVSYTDLSSWTQISGITSSKFNNRHSIKKSWPLVQATSLFVTFPDDDWQRQTTYVYDGKTHKPKVTVRRNYTQKVVAAKNYTVKYLTNCRSVGVHKIQIKLKGDYQGTLIRTFTIVSQGARLTSLVPQKNAITVNWTLPEQVKTRIDGYMIQYTGSPAGFYSTLNEEIITAKIKDKEILKKIFGNLDSDRRYFFRIYTYKTVKVDGKSVDIISGWGYDDIQYISTLKSVTSAKGLLQNR